MDLLLVFAIFLFIPTYQARQNKKDCEFPLVSTLLFNNTDYKSISLNSSANQGLEWVFPYQFVMIACSGAYPIEWVSSGLEEPNMFSYILDDEKRSSPSGVSTNGLNNTNSTEFQVKEKWTILTHFGNGTLARDNFSNLTVICQPAFNQTDGVPNCGKARFLLSKRMTKEGNKTNTFITVSFKEIARNKTGLVNGSRAGKEPCLKDELWKPTPPPLQNVTNRVNTNKSSIEFNCKPTKKSYIPTGLFLPKTISIKQLQFNLSLQNPTGVLRCVQQNNNDPIYAPYYFSLPTSNDSTLHNLYFRRSNATSCTEYDLVDEEKLVSLRVRNSMPEINTVYIGDNVTITCISSIYYFAQGMKVRIKIADNSTKEVIKDIDVKEKSFGLGGYRNATKVLHLQDKTIQKVECSAPVRKSTKWVTKTSQVEIKVPEKLLFDNSSETATIDDSTTFLLCNATGDPLPVLIWSRLNNEKLPMNQSTEIHSFQIYKNDGNLTLNMTTLPFNSTWISSKLYLAGDQSGNDLQEYYGRYICIAKNRFESIEKVFVYDNNQGVDEFSPVFVKNPSIRRIGKTLWFWVMLTLALFVMVGLLCLLGIKVGNETKKLMFFTKAEIDEFICGKPELLLYDSDCEEINSYAAYLPFDTNQFEVRREQIEFDPSKILGSGAYGTVYKGVFKYDGKSLQAAIKTVNPTSDKIYFASLLAEIKIMCYIGRHDNVVRFIGACTKYLAQRQIFVVTEFLENGDMLSYILKNRDTFINNAIVMHPRFEVGMPWNNYCRLSSTRLALSPQLLLVWASQIASGMAFLSSKKVIHGDLAARNILLSDKSQPKIGDFGLSKQLQKYSNYVQKGNDLVPWRWLAIESLQFMKFSLKSDVWAFGVVLYEMLSLGQVPFPNYTYSELFIVALCQGERLPKPLYASDKIYKLMLNCWKTAPEDRPTFASLQNELTILIKESEMEPTRMETIHETISEEEEHYLNSPSSWTWSSHNQGYGKTLISRFDREKSVVRGEQPPSPYIIDWKTFK